MLRRSLWWCLLGCLPAAAQVAPIPTSTQLPSSPFSIRKSWVIGGTGDWDYLAIDPEAQRLYIAHSRNVQVVDLDSGSLARQIDGFREAHAIALDDTGAYGYISDGPSDSIAVFDRSTLKVEATIQIPCPPRSIAFEPRSKLVFAVCGSNVVSPSGPQPPGHRPTGGAGRGSHGPVSTDQENFAGISHVIAIDTQQRTAIADIAIAGDARFAQADGGGAVYLTVGEAERFEYRDGATRHYRSPPRIARFDGPAIAAEAERIHAQLPSPDSESPVSMDWSEDDRRGARANFSTLLLPSSCDRPQGVAVDAKDFRLFAACNDQQLLVLNAANGRVITNLVTGPGADVVGYDPDRQLIFSANGAGYGSLTIVQQDANTDSYDVIQTLPTLARARTLAVDSSTGNVYLVTDYLGVDLTPRGPFGQIKTAPVAGSFQVLVVGR